MEGESERGLLSKSMSIINLKFHATEFTVQDFKYIFL